MLLDIKQRTTAEDSAASVISYNDLRLEDPGLVTVLLRLGLPVDQKQRHQSITLTHRSTHASLETNLGDRVVHGAWRE